NSEATATRPLSLWERVRERAVSRRLTSKSITLSQSLCALKTERSSENGAFEGSRVSAKLKPKLQKIEKQRRLSLSFRRFLTLVEAAISEAPF
ncbi:hypothetical protein, partial [Neisseria meningitidis]|uniref:hypothetical protein n=1 Tax=Neisseria meningitidis TaxID=487 RepID=UPI001E4833DC